jgi:hypothetical protein
MDDHERALLGEWRQVRPVPDPAAISVRFESGGRLTYIVEMGSTQEIELQWRVEGDVLVIAPVGAASGERTPFRLRSPTVLVLEREGERFVYFRA